jgi:pentatricopeptide repeat protein
LKSWRYRFLSPGFDEICITKHSAHTNHDIYAELIGASAIADDWSKVAALYEEMIAEGLTPTHQTSLWAISAYIGADQEYKASTIIDSLVKVLPNGSARLLWAGAYIDTERWQTALELFGEAYA